MFSLKIKIDRKNFCEKDHRSLMVTTSTVTMELTGRFFVVTTSTVTMELTGRFFIVTTSTVTMELTVEVLHCDDIDCDKGTHCGCTSFDCDKTTYCECPLL